MYFTIFNEVGLLVINIIDTRNKKGLTIKILRQSKYLRMVNKTIMIYGSLQMGKTYAGWVCRDETG
jgi:hypothetical protein